MQTLLNITKACFSSGTKFAVGEMVIVLSFKLAFTVIVVVVDIKNSPQLFRKKKKQSFKKAIAYFQFQVPDLRLKLQTSLYLHCLK